MTPPSSHLAALQPHGGPPTRRFDAAPWHARVAWRRYAEALLRYLCGRAGYVLDVHGHAVPADRDVKPLACLVPERRRVFVACRFPEAPDGYAVRGLLRLRQQPTGVWLRALLAHETAHILWTGQLPREPLLARLVNILEDERIERLQAQRHPDLTADFDTIGDVMLARALERDDTAPRQGALPPPLGLAADLLTSCLLHRWRHDAPWACALPLPDDAWHPLRPLVEEAWTASSYDNVVDIARTLLAEAGLEVDTRVPDETDLPPATGAWRDLPAGSDPGGDPGRIAPPPSSGGAPQGGAPQAPGRDPHGAAARRAQALGRGLDAVARRLAPVLHPPTAAPLPVPSSSRGRYDYQRDVRGCDRAFVYTPTSSTSLFAVDIVLDVSYSMGPNPRTGYRLRHAQRAALAIIRACSPDGPVARPTGVPVRVIPFRERPLPSLTAAGNRHAPPAGALTYEALASEVAALTAEGTTALAPALAIALQTPSPSAAGRIPLVVILTDGELTEPDAHAAAEILRSAPTRAAIVPILIAEAADASEPLVQPYRRLFQHCAVVTDATTLPAVAERCLRAACPPQSL